MDLGGNPDRHIQSHKESGHAKHFSVLHGDVVHYYLTAMLTHGVYGWSFILGWTVFACLSPAMAYLAWMTKQRGVLQKIIGAGILLFSIASSILLFDRKKIKRCS